MFKEEKIHDLYLRKRTQLRKDYWHSDPDMDPGRRLESQGLLAVRAPTVPA